MQTPTLYLFVGYPGAGKTTVARYIHELTGAIHLWSDQERHIMFGKQPTHSPQESRQLYDHLNGVVEELLQKGESVIFDTNFNYYKDRELMRKLALKHNARAVVIWLSTDVALAKKRATEESHGEATRVWGNMPASAFDRMSGNLEPPRPEEQAIKLEGVGLTKEHVAQALGIA